MKTKLFITCEHATNQIPEKYQSFFNNKKCILASHRGWDIGAYAIYQSLINHLECDHMFGDWSRLLIELNRPLSHPQLFSEFTSKASQNEKNELIKMIHTPYWQQASHKIQKQIKKGICTLHLSIHSFTPNLNGNIRHADIGLLYDPRRKHEKIFCEQLKKVMNTQCDFRIRKNYPYKGISAGLTTHLRKQFAENHYLGMEIEVNQKHLIQEDVIKHISNILIESIGKTLLTY